MGSRRLLLALFALVIQVAVTTAVQKRKNVNSLTDQEQLVLKKSLKQLVDDRSQNGYQKMAAYYGQPSLCTSEEGRPAACSIRGNASSPLWHRLYVVQLEQLLVRLGLTDVGVPYWDWTQPITALPSLVQEATFKDNGASVPNPWSSGRIELEGVNTNTERTIDERLFERVGPGQKSKIMEMVLDALEQEDYCKFQVQLEIASNNIPYLVGGNKKHSVSSVEYAAYDPLFFLHLANVDRIFVIWQELQKKRNKVSDRADCSVEISKQKLQPFDRESNPIQITKITSIAKDVFKSEKLGYTYDDLTLNGMNIDQLKTFLEQRQKRERTFASVSLHSLGTSATVQVQVCEYNHPPLVDTHSKVPCENAGEFYILGGANELPWEMNLPFHYDISEVLLKRSKPLDSNTYLQIQIVNKDGSIISVDSSNNTISYRPSCDQKDPPISQEKPRTAVVRKDISTLTEQEVHELRKAMEKFQNDNTTNGYQTWAQYHGLPPQCPKPDAPHRYACSIHGMPTFPHWHRLYVVQVEDALKSFGLKIGVPYWDFTRPNTSIPAIAAKSTYTDPSGQTVHNPFYDAPISFQKQTTRRNIRPELSQIPAPGKNTDLFNGILLALEQKDFCDFEVQLEVIQNAPNFLVGGFTPYSLTTLHYSAFDPLFPLVHSNMDRIWGIWQALQIRRGLPYKAHCAHSKTQEYLRPFAFESPLNNNQKTRSHAKASTSYDYERELDYTYDKLTLGEMSVEQLDVHIKEQEKKDRTFVGIMLHSIGISALIDVTVVAPGGRTLKAGYAIVLGGEKEIPWKFDRPYKIEITDTLKALGLRPEDKYEVKLTIKDVNEKVLPDKTFKHVIIYQGPSQTSQEERRCQTIKKTKPIQTAGDSVIRQDIIMLTDTQTDNLKNALKKMQSDLGRNGFEAIASFHGAPGLCPENATHRYACCKHGMTTFPHWHRLLTVQIEMALKANGATVGVPYWDWTRPSSALPSLLTDTNNNPFRNYYITFKNETVDRTPQPELFQRPLTSGKDAIFYQALETLEETNYCDFEVQFEILHNAIHYLVGGPSPNSMSTLECSAFDPFFMIHHSSIDRIWILWQELQKMRGKPYRNAKCAQKELNEPLEPFSYSSINPNVMTRLNSRPVDVIDIDKFKYSYDKLDLNGNSIIQLKVIIEGLRSRDRIYAGFVLAGVGASASVKVKLESNGKLTPVGTFYILGGEDEMPWAYERLYKLDITDAANELGLTATSDFKFAVEFTSYNGTPLEFSQPDLLVVHRPANSDYDVVIIPIGTDKKLPPKVVVRRGTQIRFHLVDPSPSTKNVMSELGSYTVFARCIIPPGDANVYEMEVNHRLEPGDYYFSYADKVKCKAGVRLQITVEDE